MRGKKSWRLKDTSLMVNDTLTQREAAGSENILNCRMRSPSNKGKSTVAVCTGHARLYDPVSLPESL